MKNNSCKYAFDENKHLVYIDDISKTNKKEHTFYCIECGNEMIVKLGEVKTHHFAHKYVNNCNKETYLHKLAKILFKKKWESSDKFFIEFKQNVSCNKSNSCYLYEQEPCSTIKEAKYDLKKYYDICLEEAPIKGYIADLLICSSIINREPILLEFWVTHKNSKEKQQSGLKIIEIKIDSEEELCKLIEKECITEKSIECRYEIIDIISFLNFKDTKLGIDPIFRSNIIHFIIYNSGKIYFEFVSCNEINKKSTNTLFECFISSFHYEIEIPVYIKQIGIMEAKRSGKIDKLCYLCIFYHYNEYYSKNICILYKKHSIVMEPLPINAMSCPYYKQKDNSMNENVTNCKCKCLIIKD